MNAIECLKSEECICGHRKLRGQSLCTLCYNGLPRVQTFDLMVPVGRGFEQAWDKSVAWLKVNGRLKWMTKSA